MAVFLREYCNSAKSTSQNMHGRDRNFRDGHFYPQKVAISFEPKLEIAKNPRRDAITPLPRHRPPDVFGTTCGTPFRTLLEPFSVPLLGKNIPSDFNIFFRFEFDGKSPDPVGTHGIGVSRSRIWPKKRPFYNITKIENEHRLENRLGNRLFDELRSS